MEAVIFVKLQGSGKSTFDRDRFADTHLRLGPDLLRTRHRERIFLAACVAAKQRFVVDHTNPTGAERRVEISAARSARFRVVGGLVPRGAMHSDCPSRGSTRPSSRGRSNTRGQVVGRSHDGFVKYPRTPHLFGSRGTADDKHLGEAESLRVLADPSLIVEEKVDGTNVGIHFGAGGRMSLQCRGHLITEGMHPQYDLFKRWASAKRPILEDRLGDRFILFGEWAYARHSVHYRRLPHYFFEFDVYDKEVGAFLDLARRMELIAGAGIPTVPVLHRGPLDRERLPALIGPSRFGGRFDDQLTGRVDDLMEGLYLRTEAGGAVIGRAKVVRPEFVERLRRSEHWQHRAMVPNLLEEGADLWS